MQVMCEAVCVKPYPLQRGLCVSACLFEAVPHSGHVLLAATGLGYLCVVLSV
jgi:hypothetical protein